ncbi:hypothetical protein GW17_00024807 [Ensete ventricosum]|nr:hypothetical protein GW17_00024807 [Ensete ventricosum]
MFDWSQDRALGQGFGRCRESSLRVRREFADDDRELADRSLEDDRELVGSSPEGCRKVRHEFERSIDVPDTRTIGAVVSSLLRISGSFQRSAGADGSTTCT